MKINKKILIPVFATAMGLSVIGGVSGAVAWYQYNTKVEASWVGMSVADGGTLLISEDSGTTWDRSIVLDENVNLHPVTFPGFDGSGVPSGAKKHPEYGEIDPDEWDDATEGTDYYQYTFMLKAQKITNNAYTDISVDVKVKDFILAAVESTKANAASAMRISFVAGSTSVVYSLGGGATNTNGALDLNGDEKADYEAGYVWDTDFHELSYGSGSYQSTQLANNATFMNIPAGGVEITMTIWMEGWHSYSSSDMSMWDPATTGGATIRFGLTLGVEKSDLGIE